LTTVEAVPRLNDTVTMQLAGFILPWDFIYSERFLWGFLSLHILWYKAVVTVPRARLFDYKSNLILIWDKIGKVQLSAIWWRLSRFI